MSFSTKAKVLVVDDSVTTMQMTINSLKQAGITDIKKATDGNEAVTKAMAEEFDLVLMDCTMPNLLGIDAVKKIRELGEEVPIIMVGTEAEEIEKDKFIKAGANGFVIKPFQPKTLVELKLIDVLKGA